MSPLYILWPQTQLSSVYSKNKGILLAFPILLEGIVYHWSVFAIVGQWTSGIKGLKVCCLFSFYRKFKESGLIICCLVNYVSKNIYYGNIHMAYTPFIVNYFYNPVLFFTLHQWVTHSLKGRFSQCYTYVQIKYCRHSNRNNWNRDD